MRENSISRKNIYERKTVFVVKIFMRENSISSENIFMRENSISINNMYERKQYQQKKYL